MNSQARNLAIIDDIVSPDLMHRLPPNAISVGVAGHFSEMPTTRPGGSLPDNDDP